MSAAELVEPPTLSRRGTVLVVDDEEGVRASIRAILEGTCEVLEAETGADALELLRAREVDLVMLDQRMPGKSPHRGLGLVVGLEVLLPGHSPLGRVQAV